MTETERRHPLVWFNVLSLDAPLVALVWQALFAWHMEVPLSVGAQVVLAASVWLVYAGDRMLDGLRIKHPVSARHQFAKRFLRPLSTIWAIVLTGNVWVAFTLLPRTSLTHGFLLLGLTVIYFCLVHLPKPFGWLRGLKEGAAGILFGLGTIVFLLPEGTMFPSQLVLPVILWCSLCFLNCCAIACWEVEIDRREQQESLFTRWSFLQRHLTGGALGLSIVALLLVTLQPSGWTWVYGSVGLSSLILLLLHRISPSINREQLRISADLALLTPVIFIIWLQAQ